MAPGGGQCGPVRDRRDLGGVHVEVAAEALPGRSGHDNHGAGRLAYGLQHLLLVLGRPEQHGVGDDDGGDRKAAQDGKDLVTVRTTVQAVLVLHDGGAATV